MDSGSKTRDTVSSIMQPLHLSITLFVSGWGKFSSSSTGMLYEGYWKDGLKVWTLTSLIY